MLLQYDRIKPLIDLPRLIRLKAVIVVFLTDISWHSSAIELATLRQHVQIDIFYRQAAFLCELEVFGR